MAKFYCPTKLSENISETPEGYLLCVGVPIARTGVMEYGEGETPLEVGDDGRVHVMRDADEVFRPATIASFEGKSVTIKHPEDFVGPHNWKELTKGTVHNVRRGKEKDEDGEESLLADVLITEAFAISLVKNGLREVSCGYEAEYEQTGEGKGKQTNIVGNHLALVEEGRAGSSYAIHDHKGRIAMGKSIGDKLKKLLGKTIDECVAEGDKAKKPAAKIKAKDEAVVEKTSGKEKVVTTFDGDAAYDELKKMYDEMGEKLAAMKPKAKDDDEEKEESEDDDEEKEEKAKEESKDDDDDEEEKEESEDDEEMEGSKEDKEILERLKALEAAVAKMLEAEESEAHDDDEEEKEESEDDDLEGEEGEESQKKTGDAKVKAAKKTGLEKTKSVDTKPITFESFDSSKEDMTPEKMNELNAAHWARK